MMSSAPRRASRSALPPRLAGSPLSVAGPWLARGCRSKPTSIRSELDRSPTILRSGSGSFRTSVGMARIWSSRASLRVFEQVDHLDAGTGPPGALAERVQVAHRRDALRRLPGDIEPQVPDARRSRRRPRAGFLVAALDFHASRPGATASVVRWSACAASAFRLRGHRRASLSRAWRSTLARALRPAAFSSSSSSSARSAAICARSPGAAARARAACCRPPLALVLVGLSRASCASRSEPVSTPVGPA